MAKGLATKDLRGTTTGKYLRVGSDAEKTVEEVDAPTGGGDAFVWTTRPSYSLNGWELSITNTPAATLNGNPIAFPGYPGVLQTLFPIGDNQMQHITIVGRQDGTLAAKLGSADSRNPNFPIVASNELEAHTFSYIPISAGATFTAEEAQDAIAAMIAAGTQSGMTITYDDANNRMSFATTGGGSGTKVDTYDNAVPYSTGDVVIVSNGSGDLLIAKAKQAIAAGGGAPTVETANWKILYSTTPTITSATTGGAAYNVAVNTNSPIRLTDIPSGITVDTANSVLGRVRVITMKVAATPGSIPSVTGLNVAKYPNDPKSYVNTANYINKLWLLCDTDADGTKSVYYIWR